MLDVLAGDVLVIGTHEYPIRFVEPYEGWGLTPTFIRSLSKTASTKRAPAIASGKRGDPATFIASLKCTIPLPISKEFAQRVVTKGTYSLMQAYAGNTDGFVLMALEVLK